jgi:hypothetical protein
MNARTLFTALLTALSLVGTAASANAQWVHHPSPGLPRTSSGAPDLTAPVPRTAHGRPDLSGVWQADGAPIPELMRLLPGGENGLGEDIPTKYFINLLADFAPGTEPLQPAAAAAVAGLSVTNISKDDVGINCLPAGVPMFMTVPAPFKIVQTPGLVVMLSEADTSFRQVFMDGRAHPADPQPSWLGSSIGKWDGDTLVIESVGFNDRGQLDALGHRHSSQLRLTERYHRRDSGHMDVQLTFDDLGVFTRPVTVSFGASLKADTDLIEYFCSENEKVRHRIFASQ